MKPHKFADIFPMMPSKEFEELKKDIKLNGQMDKIITYKGEILDGRNRFKAVSELGLKPILKEYNGENPLQYVMSTNLKRRHLTSSQKAIVGLRYKPYYSEFAKKRQKELNKPWLRELVPEADKGKSSDKAGEVVGVSGRYIDMAEQVLKERPGVEEKIMKGEIKLKQVLRDIKLEKQKKDIEELKEVTGEYDVIAIDPPWKYVEKYDPDGRRGACPYLTMSQQELRNIKIPSSDNCVLFLWTTHRFIWDAKELLDHWGFEYKCILTWDKEKMGLGMWLRMQSEFCLIGIKGKPYWKLTNERDLIREGRTTHSTKPESFYTLVEGLCAGKKLDYFSRSKREGWDCFGDEVQ